MDYTDFESKLEAFIKRYRHLGLTFFEANPQWIVSAGLQMIWIAIRCLQRDIDDPRVKHVSWDSPLTMVAVPVEISDTLEPVPFALDPRALRNRRSAARATLRTLAETRMIFLLSALTRGVVALKQRDRYYVYFPAKVERELGRLPPRKRAKLTEELVNPPPDRLEFRLHGTGERGHPVDITAKIEVTFCPLYVDDELQQALYPVWIRMRVTGANPRRWSRKFKSYFWRKLLRVWRSHIPKENLGCLAEVARDMRLAKVTVEELVDREHARDYKELVQSYATCQAQHLEKTGRFQAVEGPFPLARIRARADLTAKQRRDHLKYDYLSYHKVSIPGAVPLKRSNLIAVNEMDIRMGDADLALLLRLAAELKKGKGGWVHIDDLIGERVVPAGGKYQAFGRLRKALQAALPSAATLELIQGDDLGRFRLSVHPDFLTYNKSKLLEHPEGRIREVAKQLPRQRTPKTD